MSLPVTDAGVEILLFGRDGLLWQVNRYKTSADTRSPLTQERRGPLIAGEKRRVGLMLPHGSLPEPLKGGPGRVEVLVSLSE
jgi:hypothetical protein